MTQPKLKIKKGDEVIVITGRDKGKKGEVLKVLTSENRVIVQGVNLVTKHQKPTQVSPGGINKKELSIHISNVAVADPKTDKPTRVGYKLLNDGKKVRIARKSGEEIGVGASKAKDKPAKAKAEKAKAKPKKEAAKKDAPKAKKETKAKKEK